MKLNPKLSFEFIGNACGIFIGNNGTKIICDPWIVDGVFDGSWFHYPPLKTIFDDIKNVDAIYISHLHPDHFDERHFKFELNIPILVLDDGPNFLIKKLENLGYKNLIKLRIGKLSFTKNLTLRCLPPLLRTPFMLQKLGTCLIRQC